MFAQAPFHIQPVTMGWEYRNESTLIFELDIHTPTPIPWAYALVQEPRVGMQLSRVAHELFSTVEETSAASPTRLSFA
ncbi:hypothetical protein RZS08_37020, partial [Arthrospira platensis SPKY1]|nr:hypothetical protein [Arthrospira platensis SPKY1]